MTWHLSVSAFYGKGLQSARQSARLNLEKNPLTWFWEQILLLLGRFWGFLHKDRGGCWKIDSLLVVMNFYQQVPLSDRISPMPPWNPE